MCFDSTTQSQTQLPDWLTGAAQSTVGQAQTAQTDETAAGYQPLSFTGTGLTDASQLQDQGFNDVSNDQGAWVQQFEQGQGALSSALNQPSALSAGSPLINSAAGTSALSAASPLIASGTGAGGLATAQPFLSAASQTAPGAIQSYLSPYTSDVVNNISRLGNQNLTENILPAVNDTFTGAGQFGSDRNAQQVGRAVRDTQTNISGLQAQALESGYGTAGSLFESDAARQAGLAGTAGSLGESAAGRDLSGASLTGSLATSDAARQLAAGQALGSLQATTTGQDLSASQQAGALAAEQQGLTASDNSQLLGAGGVQYGINAANNATAQQNAQQQNVISQQNAQGTQQYPEQQLSWLNSIIRGTPSGQTTTSTSPSTSASSLGALGLLGAGLASKYNWFGAADGGRVPLADGGDPGDDEFDPLQRELALRRLSALANTDPTAGQVSDAGALSSVPPPQAPSDPGYVVGGAFPTAADTMLNRQPSADDIRVPSDGALAQASPPPSNGALSATPADTAPMGALAQHLKQSTYSDADIKDAMDNVKDLQKSALAPRTRKDSWANDPIIITALGALASGSPNPFTALGKGALGAVENEVSNRKQDYALDKESRIEALKAAQQNLSNIVSMRRDDTTRAMMLGRGDISNDKNAAQAAANDARIQSTQAIADQRVQSAQAIADARIAELVRHHNELEGADKFTVSHDEMGRPFTVNTRTGQRTDLPPPAAAAPAETDTLRGDDYLKTLPQQDAAQVKALAEGRMAFPSSFALAKPYWQNMLRSVSQYDPEFDATNYNVRAQTRQAFAKGQPAQNITSLNTVMGHLDNLSESAKSLNNSTFTSLNTIGNLINQKTGDPRIKQFQLDANAVADELTRVFRGTGGSETEVQRWHDSINSSDSPAQLQATVQEATKLIKSRMDAIGDQYTRGMGPKSEPLRILEPHSQKIFDRLNGAASDGTPSPPATPSKPTAPAADKPRNVVIQNGMRFDADSGEYLGQAAKP